MLENLILTHLVLPHSAHRPVRNNCVLSCCLATWAHTVYSLFHQIRHALWALRVDLTFTLSELRGGLSRSWWHDFEWPFTSCPKMSCHFGSQSAEAAGWRCRDLARIPLTQACPATRAWSASSLTSHSPWASKGVAAQLVKVQQCRHGESLLPSFKYSLPLSMLFLPSLFCFGG